MNSICEPAALPVDEVKAMLTCNERGKIMSCLQNSTTALQHDPMLAGKLQMNRLTESVALIGDVGWEHKGNDLTDYDLLNIRLRLEKYYAQRKKEDVRDAVDIVAAEHGFHPIQRYIEALEWDGVPRISDAFHHFFGTEHSELSEAALKVFMYGALERIYHPGCKFDTMLCLVGGQGCGKSTFFRFMALKDEWFTDDLQDITDVNVYRRMRGHWIIECGEMLATAKAKTVEDTKAFFSRQNDIYKDLYKTLSRDRPRQCVFGGTSNKKIFLPFDRSGNRRFHPVDLGTGKDEVHILDNEEESRAYIRQMWAEAYAAYSTGAYSLTLSPELEAEMTEYRKQFMAEDSIIGLITFYLENYTGTFVCARQLYREALHNIGDPTNRETADIYEVMDAIPGWKRVTTHRFPNYGTQRGWQKTTPEWVEEAEKCDQMMLPF